MQFLIFTLSTKTYIYYTTNIVLHILLLEQQITQTSLLLLLQFMPRNMTTNTKSTTYIVQLLASEQQCYCNHYFLFPSFSSFLNNYFCYCYLQHNWFTQLQLCNTTTIHSNSKNEQMIKLLLMLLLTTAKHILLEHIH